MSSSLTCIFEVVDFLGLDLSSLQQQRGLCLAKYLGTLGFRSLVTRAFPFAETST